MQLDKLNFICELFLVYTLLIYFNLLKSIGYVIHQQV